MHWFVGTMTVLAISAIYSLVCITRRKTHKPLTYLWVSLGTSSVVTSAEAVAMTNFGTVNGPVYSVDCIWYNAVLAVICFAVAAVDHFIKRGRGRQTS
jgi:hypothetical protein